MFFVGGKRNVVGVSLAFPGGTEVEDQRSKAIKRTADLPVVFENATQYKTLFGEALHENLQVQVTQLAITYHTLRAEWAQKHDGATRAPDGKTHEDFFRFKGVNLYVESTLRCVCVCVSMNDSVIIYAARSTTSTSARV